MTGNVYFHIVDVKRICDYFARMHGRSHCFKRIHPIFNNYMEKLYLSGYVALVEDPPIESNWRYKEFPQFREHVQKKHLSTLSEQEVHVAKRLRDQLHKDGHALFTWNVVCPDASALDVCDALVQHMGYRWPVMIHTTSHVFFQMLSRDKVRVRIHVLKSPEHERVFDSEDIRSTMGMSPDQVHNHLFLTCSRQLVEFWALTGQYGAPGIPGVGEKSAKKYLLEPGSPEAKEVEKKINNDPKLWNLSKKIVKPDASKCKIPDFSWLEHILNYRLTLENNMEDQSNLNNKSVSLQSSV